jgi:hypothetical protein
MEFCPVIILQKVVEKSADVTILQKVASTRLTQPGSID